MATYKIGDKVKVTSAKISVKKPYIGKIYTIDRINPNGRTSYNESHYGVAEYCPFVWFESELEPVEEKIEITHDGKVTTATMYGVMGKVTATARCAPEDKFDFNVGAKLAMERLMDKLNPAWKFNTGDHAKIIANYHHHQFDIGTIVKLERTCSEGEYRAYANDTFWYVLDEELDAYTPPKYYNGKVVCIKNSHPGSVRVSYFTIGKVYDVVDGVIISDTGYKSERYKTVNDLCVGMGHTFIPIVE